MFPAVCPPQPPSSTSKSQIALHNKLFGPLLLDLKILGYGETTAPPKAPYTGSSSVFYSHRIEETRSGLSEQLAFEGYIPAIEQPLVLLVDQLTEEPTGRPCFGDSQGTGHGRWINDITTWHSSADPVELDRIHRIHQVYDIRAISPWTALERWVRGL